MTNLTRLEPSAFEGCVVYLEAETNDIYVSGGELARLIDGDKTTIRRWLKRQIEGGAKGYILDVEIPTPGGIQRGSLYGEDLIIDAVAHFNVKLLKELTRVTLKNFYKLQISDSVGDVGDSVQKVLGSWKDARQFTISLQLSFQNACLAKRHPAPQVHDLITKLLTGYSAADARRMPLVDETSAKSIGLNHQPNPQELANIAMAKANYIRYRKGTWQEQVLRAVDETGYTIGS